MLSMGFAERYFPRRHSGIGAAPFLRLLFRKQKGGGDTQSRFADKCQSQTAKRRPQRSGAGFWFADCKHYFDTIYQRLSTCAERPHRTLQLCLFVPLDVRGASTPDGETIGAMRGSRLGQRIEFITRPIIELIRCSGGSLLHSCIEGRVNFELIVCHPQ